MSTKVNAAKIFGHLRTIHTHRKWVRKYCWKLGLFRQGLTHDLSKYSPTEFWESVKYYQGTASPIDACKKANGYSEAWMHHKGRNKHHYEYWMDNFDFGGQPILMPYKYFAEMLCDYMGAGRAYQGKNFSYYNEWLWWRNKKASCAMHPKMIQMFDIIFWDLMQAEVNGWENPDDIIKDRRYVRNVYEANR